MICRLFTAASAISLLLCFAALVLWTKSYESRWVVSWKSWRIQGYLQERHSYELEEGCGVLAFLSTTDVDPGALIFPDGSIHFFKPQPDDICAPHLTIEETNRPLFAIGDTLSERLGFLRMKQRLGRSEGYTDIDFIFVPAWLLAAAFIVLPIVTIARAFRVRRCVNGACAECGYDLRASTGRCPECGTPILGKVPT